MADATMERPERGQAQREVRYLDLVDQWGPARARSVIREALTFAGVKPVEVNWEQRRAETFALIERLEAALDRDLKRFGLT
ncbi:MAG: hypothetical protein K6U89_09895 [Chloroflexi bacterium]|nr:hypothetical protein [Chloroflexota bacterium]